MRKIIIAIFFNEELKQTAGKIFRHLARDFEPECFIINSFGPRIESQGFSIRMYKITENIRGVRSDICIYPKEELLSDIDLQRIFYVYTCTKRIEYDAEGELLYG